MFRQAIPVLHVRGAAAAERFYGDVLGFRRTFAHRADPASADPCYLGVARDGVTLHLSSFAGDGVAGAVVFLEVDDVDALYQDLVRRGVGVRMPPTDQTWGNREMYVDDPDGNVMRFIQPLGG